MSAVTEVTELLGFELNEAEKSLVGYGETRGRRLERERMFALLDNELEMCTCEEPLVHLRKRLEMIRIQGGQK